MDVKVTEVSLSFRVTKPPRTHVDKIMPFFVSTIGDDIERVVKHGGTEFPWWIASPQPDAVRFVYSLPVQDVECSYSMAKSAIVFGGIKYKNVDEFNGHINEVLKLLDTESIGTPKTKYKAIAKVKIHVPWDRDVLADIVTNDPDVAQTMAMCERTGTLGSRRLFSVVADLGDDKTCRIALTCRDDGLVSAMISKLHDEGASARVAQMLVELFDIYEHSLHAYRSKAISVRCDAVSGIQALRKEVPELFVNNYTRECPVLPVMVSEEEAKRIQHTQRVIYYPQGAMSGRYYTAPDGYFVGLKRNRLANRHDFPCLVTCYLHDHMERKGSETYKYYNAIRDDMETSKKRPLPKSISNPRYHRMKAGSFMDAVESAASTNVPSFPWCPQIVRQELWSWSDDEIMRAVRSEAPVAQQTSAGAAHSSCHIERARAPGSSLYRYFEEVLEVSIHVVTISDGNFEPLVPPHRGKYVWAPPYPLHVVIFETYKTTYGEQTCSYEFLADNTTSLFGGDDSVVSYLISQKSEHTVPPAALPDTVCEQIIDMNGKCSMVTTEDGHRTPVYTRPLGVPVVPEPTCFLDSHVRKMNVAKRELGLKPVDLSKRSSDDILYFPNDASFKYYVGRSVCSA